MRFLKSGFFHQTTPPGPIRDILEPFSFLANFHGVMYIFKRHRGVAIPQCPGNWRVFFYWCPGYRGVLTPGVRDTGEF